jgi:hypothetical protein
MIDAIGIFRSFSSMRLKHYWFLWFFSPFCLLGERNCPRHSHERYDCPSYIPISPTMSDVLVGTLQRHRSSWLSRSRQNERYWLSDAHGHPMIELDFGSFPIPRNGLEAWVGQRVHIRGEKIDRGRRPSLLRVTFIQKAEEMQSASQLSSAMDSCPKPVCKRLSTTSSSRH